MGGMYVWRMGVNLMLPKDHPLHIKYKTCLDEIAMNLPPRKRNTIEIISDMSRTLNAIQKSYTEQFKEYYNIYAATVNEFYK